MKGISLKLKLTLLYTFFMVLLTCAVLVILLSLSSRELLASVEMKLEHRVQESLDDISFEDGKVVLDKDFYSVYRDVYLSLYDSDMYFLYGKVPYGFDQQPEFSDGQTRVISEGSKEWYVYDIAFRLTTEQTVYVRGITSLTDAEENLTTTIRIAFVILPLMVLAAAAMGYLFTGHTLKPVREMTDTVNNIRSEKNLSLRIGVSGKNRDEIQNLAVTFDEMLEELELAFKREKQFTSDVSHELRTPVSVILAQCSLLCEDETLTDDQLRQIRLIEKKARGMSDMVSRLLFLSRADQGRQTLCLERLNLSEVTEMVVEEQQFLADSGQKKIGFIKRIEPEIYALADETLYIRMLINLLSNAVRYSHDGGNIEVFLERKGGNITVRVKDYGIGIPVEVLPHVWERFYRADESRTGGEHSGLGLSMVKWIAQAHGGDVHAESQEGQGSCFTVSIPAAGEKAAEK